MSTQNGECGREAQFCGVYGDLLEFERKLAAARKRTRSADYLDRKLVISDSTEFERHFDNLSEAIARLLPYHTFYVDEIKSNRIEEDEKRLLERRNRIRDLEESIMGVSTSSHSFAFNACGYGLIRAIHSCVSMDLDRHKKELSQLQALELAWKYPMDNTVFPCEKPTLGGPSIQPPGNVPMMGLGISPLDHGAEFVYQGNTPKNSISSQNPIAGLAYSSRHPYDSGSIVGHEADALPNSGVPGVAGVVGAHQNQGLEAGSHFKGSGAPRGTPELHPLRASSLIQGETFQDSIRNDI